MRDAFWLTRLCASVLVVSLGSAAAAGPVDDALKDIQKQIDDLNKKGNTTVNPGSLAIESWLLTATAVDATAGKVHTAVGRAVGDRTLLVVGGPEAVEFGRALVMKAEIDLLARRLRDVCRCQNRLLVSSSFPAIAGAVIGLLKSETSVTGIDQSLDARLLAAAVAGKFGNAILPSAAVSGGADSDLMRSFGALVETADAAQREYETLAAVKDPSGPQKDKRDRLKALLDIYDALYKRVATANAEGVVPLAVAARLHALLEKEPLILRVTPEKAGGTLLKRTNVVTALGGESVFVSGGLVSSYQLTDPATGRLIQAGIVTCRTTLASLKRVQNASWRSPVVVRTADGQDEPSAACSP